MILAEFTLDHPVLRETLQRCPDLRVRWEASHRTPDDDVQIIVWVDADDFAAAEAAMRADPSIADPTVLVEVDGRRLYRLALVGESRDSSIVPVLVEVGGVQQELTASVDGWRNRVSFPDRAALERLYRFCRDRDIPFTFERIYERADARDREPAELTDPQRDILVEAVESGYLSIPRQCTLAELGSRLGVSESAASERFRRAVQTLVEQSDLR